MMKSILSLFTESRIVCEIRKTGSGNHFLIELFKFVIVIICANAITGKVVSYLVNHGIEPFASMRNLPLMGIGLLTFIAIIYCALWEKFSPRCMGFSFSPISGFLKELVLGFLFGGVIMAVIALSAVLLGGFTLQSNLAAAIPSSVLSILAIYLFQALGEEAMYRGAFMMSMARKNAPIIAIVVSSLVFSIHHHFNAGFGVIAFVNLFLLGVLLGTTFFLTNRIWMAATIHAAWNFVQGNIFGVNVSGAGPDPVATTMICTAKGSAFINGGAMGLEGSLVSTVVLLLALAGVYLFYRKRRAKASSEVAKGNSVSGED